MNCHPGVAMVLSFIVPGLGQIYCGRLARGVIVTSFYGFSWGVMLGVASAAEDAAGGVFFLGMIWIFAFWVAGMADARHVATRTNQQGTLAP